MGWQSCEPLNHYQATLHSVLVWEMITYLIPSSGITCQLRPPHIYFFLKLLFFQLNVKWKRPLHIDNTLFIAEFFTLCCRKCTPRVPPKQEMTEYAEIGLPLSQEATGQQASQQSNKVRV